MHTHPYLTAVYFVLRFIVVLMLLLNLWERDYESAFICVLSLILFLLPAFIERQLRVQIPTLMEMVILWFIFGAEILGELQNYYVQYPYCDTILHATNGFVCAAFGFSLIDILTRNRQEKFRLSPLYVSLVAFCFSMTVGVLWEFFEYGMDLLFLTDMQKDTVLRTIASVELAADGRVAVLQDVTAVTVNGQELGVGGYLDVGLHDTMADLLVNFFGAVVFSVLGFFYIRHRGKGRSGRLLQWLLPIPEGEKPPPETAENNENVP
ncbi:MAG: hypothetical protein IJN04_04890 [Clostridia bacterium]|nr:hypothetical protein [Clostridia bacterium]